MSTLPADLPVVPANGTRDWNTTVVGNGTFLATKIPTACPPDHAFVDLWTNELDNECQWSEEYGEAVWKFWHEPGLNMTEDPNRLLPQCVRK